MRFYRVAIWLGAALFAAAYFLLDVNRLRTYAVGGDFGLFLQSANDPSGLLRNTSEGGSHFAVHFSPIYDLVMPLVVWSHSALPMIAFQVVAGALVAVGLFELARTMMPERLAFTVGAIALFYPALAGVVFGDPYENVFAPAATVWLAYAAFSRKWLVAAALAMLTLAVKEDQAAFLIWDALLLLAIAYRRRDVQLRNFSLCLGLGSAAVLLGFFYVVRPLVASDSHWAAMGGAMQIAKEDPTHGHSLIGRLGYVAEIVVPLAFLPFVEPLWVLFAIAPIAEVLLATNSNVYTMGTHYAGVWIGYVLIAAAFGAAALYRRSPKLAQRFVVAALVLCIADLAFASPTHWAHNVHRVTQHDRDLDRILAMDLPHNVTIGTHDEFYARLWTDPTTQHGLLRSPEYALIDETMHDSAIARSMLDDVRAGRYGTYRLVWQRNGVDLFRRVGPIGSTVVDQARSH